MVTLQLSDPNVIQKTVDILHAGGLVIYPTETTYGLGVDATNPKAVQKVLDFKTQRGNKPLSILVSNIAMAEQYVQLNEVARKAYASYLPGPVTVVSTGMHTLPLGVESSAGTLGIRMSSYTFAADLVRTFGKPITATGANASYQKRPYSVADVLDNISQRQRDLIDAVVDAGQLPPNPPSTVIDTTLDDVVILRKGEVAVDENTTSISHSVEATERKGKELIQKYKNYLSYKSIIICINGPMGAGKTQFVRGIAEGLNVQQLVNSPTYTVAKQYPFFAEGQNLLFVHVDTWRMQTESEIRALHLEQLLTQRPVIVVEWADRFPQYFDSLAQHENVLSITVSMQYEIQENERRITILEK